MAESITDYELLLLTYTQNAAPVKPSKDDENSSYSRFAKLANSVSHGDTPISFVQPSVETVKQLKQTSYNINDLSMFLEDREAYVTEGNRLKQKILLNDDRTALRQRKILQNFITEQSVLSANQRSKLVLQREKEALQSAKNTFLFYEEQFISMTRWSAFQQLRFLGEDQRKQEGKVLAKRQALLQKSINLQLSFIEQYETDSLKFLSGLQKFRQEQAKVNSGCDDIIASEAFIAQVDGERDLQHIFNVKIQSVEGIFDDFE
ncbi:hypothetical protein SS50377_20996 [Spironucleus salmonicida]|uniref:Uncharacterized protein n=1 Tax=Spironucleus salmonicida TaxID=348837 RepID=V6LHA3_9EUKA|nr:hypothetical protein SS50377_20996 [Spironucleus salmonicida]|eukprot:EST43663.1 Hypothetical protein SS50377_16706 [Spironucleus salmonicida]